jgi:hypothetical protein
MNSIKWPILAALPFAMLALPGCSGIGPSTIVPSRFDYTAAIGDSWKQQMLINMVKMRYGDSLVFLDVTSVISQYQVVAGANWNGTFNNQSESNVRTFGATGTAADPVTGAINRGATIGSPFLSNTQAFGVTGGYSDRPTITYVPLSGEKFTRTLMKPIPPTSILSLIQSGYPIDLVLRFCVHSVNSVRNRFGGSGRGHPADPEFYPLLERLRRIQDSSVLGLRVVKTKDMEGIVMTFGSKADPQTEEDVAYVRKALGLDPTASEFKVAFGAVAKDRNEIAMLSRSMLEIIIDLASCIEVPAAHVEEKRVNPSMPDDMVEGVPVPPLIRVHSSRQKPADAFIAVPYRNHWFWIDDRDMRSKTIFSFMMMIFSLTDTETKEGTPIITVPSG